MQNRKYFQQMFICRIPENETGAPLPLGPTLGAKNLLCTFLNCIKLAPTSKEKGMVSKGASNGRHVVLF